MTPQEAIKFLKIWRNAIESRGDGPFSEAVMALTYGIEALEKQMPKKPIMWGRHANGDKVLEEYECPNCGAKMNGERKK